METCVLLANLIHHGKAPYYDEPKGGLNSFAVHYAKEVATDEARNRSWPRNIRDTDEKDRVHL